jgi:hypothetical protein
MTERSLDRARTAATRLSWLVVGLMAVQSGAGLLFPGMYRDAPWIRAAWFGNDIVTLAVAVPLLVAGLLLARRGSVRGRLVWYAGLGYGVYNYGYYAFGAQLNIAFPLYVAALVSAMWALALALGSEDVPAVARSFPTRTPVRGVASYMAFTGIGLAVAWIAQWAAYAFGGTVPSIGVEPFRLVASMDLSLMVPIFCVGAVLLWRRHAWGFVLGAIAIIQGAAYTLGLTLSSVVGGLRSIAGAMEQAPVWAAWTLAGVAAAVALLRSVRADA